MTNPVTIGRDPGPARLERLRAGTRHLIGDESRALLDTWAHRGREAHRSLLLAYVTGYLGAYCEQVDTDPTIHPREIAAVLRGVLDAVESAHRPREAS